MPNPPGACPCAARTAVAALRIEAEPPACTTAVAREEPRF
jgi:hypothetical protein